MQVKSMNAKDAKDAKDTKEEQSKNEIWFPVAIPGAIVPTEMA